jgi:multidrug efflux system membrane fusion protein
MRNEAIMKRCWRTDTCSLWLILFSSTVCSVEIGCAPEPLPVPNVVRPVKTMIVLAGEDTRQRTFPGIVEAAQRVDLAFQVSGLLTDFPVKEGQKVAKGELIAQLRPDEFQARLDTLKGQLDQARATLTALQVGERPEERRRREAQVRAAEARLANARADFLRAEQLVPTRAMSRAEFERYQTTYSVAQEDLKAAREQLEAGLSGREEDIAANEAQIRGLEARAVEANIELQDTTLSAPYDGVIAQRFVEEGQNIRAGDRVIRFQDIEEVEITVDVPETVMASDIQSADIVEIVAELSGAPGTRFPVRIREIAQVADPTTQTFKVRTAMLVPEGVRVLPGMTATVTLSYRRASILGDPILVPISAVFNDREGEQVAWILGSDSKVTRRNVKLGRPIGGQIQIVEGLEPGDRIAVAGVTQLREGMKVRDLGDELGGSSP